MTQPELAQALKEASEAHHVFETNVRFRKGDDKWTDPDWPSWYAEHILRNHPELYDRDPRVF